MTDVSLSHVDRFIDRHGKPRHYFRFGRGKRTRLPGEPGSAEFLEAYNLALAQATGNVASSWPANELLQLDAAV